MSLYPLFCGWKAHELENIKWKHAFCVFRSKLRLKMLHFQFGCFFSFFMWTRAWVLGIRFFSVFNLIFVFISFFHGRFLFSAQFWILDGWLLNIKWIHMYLQFSNVQMVKHIFTHFFCSRHVTCISDLWYGSFFRLVKQNNRPSHKQATLTQSGHGQAMTTILCMSELRRKGQHK